MKVKACKWRSITKIKLNIHQKKEKKNFSEKFKLD
jgi:hypothetical protein